MALLDDDSPVRVTVRRQPDARTGTAHVDPQPPRGRQDDVREAPVPAQPVVRAHDVRAWRAGRVAGIVMIVLCVAAAVAAATTGARWWLLTWPVWAPVSALSASVAVERLLRPRPDQK